MPQETPRSIRTLGRLAFTLTIPSLLAAQTYTITDLGAVFGTSSGARGINATGQVTGYSANNSGTSVVFLYSDGKMSDLGSLGGTNAIGLAINKLIPAHSGRRLQTVYSINDTGKIAGYGRLNKQRGPSCSPQTKLGGMCGTGDPPVPRYLKINGETVRPRPSGQT